MVGDREESVCDRFLPARFETAKCLLGCGAVLDCHREHVVDCFAQLAETTERERAGVRIAFVDPFQLCEHAHVELCSRIGPLQYARVALEPVDCIAVSAGDGIDQIEHDVAADEIARAEPMGPRPHNR